MKLGGTENHDGLMLPDSAVIAWTLAYATQHQDLAFHSCLVLGKLQTP